MTAVGDLEMPYFFSRCSFFSFSALLFLFLPYFCLCCVTFFSCITFSLPASLFLFLQGFFFSPTTFDAAPRLNRSMIWSSLRAGCPQLSTVIESPRLLRRPPLWKHAFLNLFRAETTQTLSCYRVRTLSFYRARSLSADTTHELTSHKQYPLLPFV